MIGIGIENIGGRQVMRSNNLEKVAFEVQKHIKDALIEEARNRDMSLSALIRTILKEYVCKKK